MIPFSQQEIDSMVRALSFDKALGPDRFNTDFVKSAGLLYVRISTTFVMTSIMEIFVCKA